MKAWLRWCTALIPSLASLIVTVHLLSTQNWHQWGIEEMAPTTSSPTSFADLANITFTADCMTANQPIETCDPYGRPFQPYVVLPARLLVLLGLGSQSTGLLGTLLALSTVALVTGLALLIASHWRRGAGSLVVVQSALGLGAVSPGVVLGIERGQIEPLSAILVVSSLLLLASNGHWRWWGVFTSLLATVLKYLTVGMFLAFGNRETTARRNWAVFASVAASGLFLLVSIPQLRQAAATSGSSTPQTTMSAFGLTNTIATPLSGSTLNYFPPEAVANAWPTLRIVGLILFAGATAILFLAIRHAHLPSPTSAAWVLTVGSGGVLLLPYLIGSSHDYRLIFLLPLLAGAGLWWGRSPVGSRPVLPGSMVFLGTAALLTSASMLPTPQGWRWPVWIVVMGDLGLFVVMALTAALALSALLKTPGSAVVR